MSERFQNDPKADKPGVSPARKLSCEEWEAMLADYLDGTLATGELKSFHMHRETCSACGEMFTPAEQGREWLQFLQNEPQAPATLVSRILAQTSGAEVRPGAGGELMPAAIAAAPGPQVLPFWKRGFAGRQAGQSRLLMTAAMAFFSITLTLNMAGVRLSTIRLADLTPSAMSSNLNRQYHQASARVVRYYDSLRFVYEMEAQVRDWRHNADLENSVPSEKPDQSTPAPSNDGGKKGGKSEVPANPAKTDQHSAMLWGERVDATLRLPMEGSFPGFRSSNIGGSEGEDKIEAADGSMAGQAERGIA
jgi:hypothetical protein